MGYFLSSLMGQTSLMSNLVDCGLIPRPCSGLRRFSHKYHALDSITPCGLLNLKIGDLSLQFLQNLLKKSHKNYSVHQGNGVNLRFKYHSGGLAQGAVIANLD